VHTRGGAGGPPRCPRRIGPSGDGIPSLHLFQSGRSSRERLSVAPTPSLRGSRLSASGQMLGPAGTSTSPDEKTGPKRAAAVRPCEDPAPVGARRAPRCKPSSTRRAAGDVQADPPTEAVPLVAGTENSVIRACNLTRNHVTGVCPQFRPWALFRAAPLMNGSKVEDEERNYHRRGPRFWRVPFPQGGQPYPLGLQLLVRVALVVASAWAGDRCRSPRGCRTPRLRPTPQMPRI
jgi:hypothetical protein